VAVSKHWKKEVVTVPSIIIAGDWESGAIAWVAARNRTRCLILRAVSDLVSAQRGEVYGNLELFQARTKEVMKKLVGSLPGWIEQV
jgi:adenosylhomocysteine nucleosidase